jgi:hypothetical protein
MRYGINVSAIPLNEQAVLTLSESMLQLRQIDLSSCPVTDASIVPMIQRCVHLRYLELSQTRITNESLFAIAKLQHLRKLGIHATRVTETGLHAAISSLRDLCTLACVAVLLTASRHFGHWHHSSANAIVDVDRRMFSHQHSRSHFHSNSARSAFNCDRTGTMRHA